MGRLARFIRFFTGDEDEHEDPDPGDDKESDVVGKGQVDYMILKT